MEIKKLPTVKRINGADFMPYPEPEKRIVHIEYDGTDGSCYEVEMPLRQAMYLLTFLIRLKKDSGYKLPGH